MSEQEKKVVEKLKEAIPKMNDFEGSASVSKNHPVEETGNSKTEE